MVFNASEPLPEAPIDDEMATEIEAARVAASDDPQLQARLERTLAVLEGHNQIAVMHERAGAGDHSVMGALLPAFFAHLKAQAEAERVANANGLSITGLLEGSAVIHSHLLGINGDMRVAVRMHQQV